VGKRGLIVHDVIAEPELINLITVASPFASSTFPLSAILGAKTVESKIFSPNRIPPIKINKNKKSSTIGA